MGLDHHTSDGHVAIRYLLADIIQNLWLVFVVLLRVSVFREIQKSLMTTMRGYVRLQSIIIEGWYPGRAFRIAAAMGLTYSAE